MEYVILSLWTIFSCTFVGVMAYMQGRKDERLEKSINRFNPVIKDILGDMYIDENGNNVLDGGTEEYETKWKYEIGYNSGLKKAIKIIQHYQFMDI